MSANLNKTKEDTQPIDCETSQAKCSKYASQNTHKIYYFKCQESAAEVKSLQTQLTNTEINNQNMMMEKMKMEEQLNR